MTNKLFVTFISVIILISFCLTGCQTTGQKGSVITPPSQAAGKADSTHNDGRRLNIGVELFTVNRSIITEEKSEEEKIDNSDVSNANIQKSLNTGNNTSSQNSTPLEKRKIKTPTNTASRVLRDTESTYFAVRLKQLLDKTNKYGMVHVIPASKMSAGKTAISSTAFDYVISSEIFESDGSNVEFTAKYRSSINGFKEPGRKFKVSEEIPVSAYVGKKNHKTGVVIVKGDPYDVALEKIVDDFSKRVERNKKKYPVKDHQNLTLAHYGHKLAPEVYKDYPIKKERGRYKVDPSPDPANPFVSDVTMVHKLELAGLEEIEKYYKSGYNSVKKPYFLWRRETQEALLAYDNFKKERNKVMVRGGLMIAGKNALVILASWAQSGQFSTRSLAFISIVTFITELKNSMVDTDGYTTVIKYPNFETYFKHNQMYKFAELLEGYSDQMVTRAEEIETLKEGFTTLSKTIILDIGTKSKTYHGKVDEVLKEFKDDLIKEYKEATEPVQTDYSYQ